MDGAYDLRFGGAASRRPMPRFVSRFCPGAISKVVLAERSVLEFNNESAIPILTNPSQFKMVFLRRELCDQIKPFKKLSATESKIGTVGIEEKPSATICGKRQFGYVRYQGRPRGKIELLPASHLSSRSRPIVLIIAPSGEGSIRDHRYVRAKFQIGHEPGEIRWCFREQLLTDSAMMILPELGLELIHLPNVEVWHRLPEARLRQQVKGCGYVDHSNSERVGGCPAPSC